KRVHGSAAIAGGMNAALAAADRAYLLQEIDTIIDWAEQAVALTAQIHTANRPYHDEFATIHTAYLSLIGASGELELYHGGLRGKDSDGKLLFDQFDYQNYHQLIHEEVKSWSYMKFPFLTSLGSEAGWYRVGPLARVNNCDFITTPRAEAARQQFASCSGNSGGPLQHATLFYHWTRMIEALHCAETILDLLYHPDILCDDLLAQGERRRHGVGVIEAPRGTLIHDYEIDEHDLVTKANLIVSTTHNNQAMNESIRQVANRYLNGQQLDERLLNLIEVAIRAYDPCLSCATHALGKMPLQLELVNRHGERIAALQRNSNGEFERPC
ncbi:MAG: nickel-dependent hydrogenase large subunit, partial [Gammaproteobacteria bacterium]|nr:nickel-dependent hydrogenase large subunit [Gammaproteobacteria bacterium]